MLETSSADDCGHKIYRIVHVDVAAAVVVVVVSASAVRRRISVAASADVTAVCSMFCLLLTTGPLPHEEVILFL